MIFVVLNPEKIWHQEIVHLPTSSVYCSHFSLTPYKMLMFSVETREKHLRGCERAAFKTVIENWNRLKTVTYVVPTK